MTIAALLIVAALLPTKAVAEPARATPGQMSICTPRGELSAPMPLERTEVSAQIAGFGARVTVKQRFKNPSTTPIEAVYTFPLPSDAAVDSMNIRVGDRLIVGEIKRRDEARLIYETAKAAGQSAALLDQERPNIFTQSVANLMPGKPIDVEISYVQVLKYDGGEFEFSFPMVVGPRYTGATTPDPGKISPPIVPPGTRSGQTVSLSVSIDAGAPIRSMNSVLHQVDISKEGVSRAHVSLKKKDEIPNRDFILRYRVSTDTVQSALLTHYTPGRGGYFSLILMPPKAPTAKQISPKEVVFVMDQSGSQSGFPIAKSKELTLKLIKTLRQGDTFNVLGFNTSTRFLWKEPRELSPANLNEAADFVKGMEANGGTNIREGVVAALNGLHDPKKLKIVLFNTDGFVGDEKLVLDAIQKNRRDARMFTFGIGNSVNRYLIDAMSEEGKGAAEYVTTEEAADKAVDRFVQRLESPVLTNVSVSFSGVAVTDQLPQQVPDVFDDAPVVLYGRYAKAGSGTVTVSGNLGGQPWTQTVPMNLPAKSDATAVPTLWARRKIEEIERSDYLAGFYGGAHRQTQDAVEEVALSYNLMSQYTSFVAVEQRVVNIGGVQRTVRVPVEMADKVSYKGVYGTSVRGISSGIGGGSSFGGSFASAQKSSISYTTADASVDKFARSTTPADKIAKSLATAKGVQEVMIAVSALTEDNRKKLKELGVEIESEDASLKVIFAKVDASKLSEVAKLDFVQRIDPLK